MKLAIRPRCEFQLIVERDGLKDGAKLVEAVWTTTQDMKLPVNLGKGWKRESGYRHFGRLTFQM